MSGSDVGRSGIIKEGWSRCRNNTKANSPNQFYENDLLAKNVKIIFKSFPEKMGTFKIYGQDIKIDANQIYHFETTNKKIEIYLPEIFSDN